MAINNNSRSSLRRILSLAAIVFGIILLLIVPVLLIGLSFSGTRDYHLSGTLVILSAAGGMILLALWAALHD